jgi:HK97 family phage prohead protease
MKKENVEYRYFPLDVAECRISEQDDKRFLDGYASVFSQRSKMIFENGKLFQEVISPNAFDDVLQDERLDVPMTYNHNRGQLLGRTKSGTLKIDKDEKGLRYRVEIPNTQTGNEVYELAKRGDLYENSFAFIVSRDDEEWAKDDDGTPIRTIKKVSRLVDVSIVINGAYADTTVAARSLEEFETQTSSQKDEEAKREEKLIRKRNLMKRKMDILKDVTFMRSQVLMHKK